MGKKFWSDVWYFLSLSIPNKCSWKLFRYLSVLKLIMIKNATSNLNNAKASPHQYEVILTVNLSRTGFLYAGGRMKWYLMYRPNFWLWCLCGRNNKDLTKPNKKSKCSYKDFLAIFTCRELNLIFHKHVSIVFSFAVCKKCKTAICFLWML